MKTLATLVLLALLPTAAHAGTTKEDIKKLAKAGLSDDVILAFVKSNGDMDKLSTDDIIELKAAGVSDKVLQVLINPKAEATPAPAADSAAPRDPGTVREFNGATSPYTEREVIVEKPVYIDRPVYVEPVTFRPSCTVVPLSSNWCSGHRCYDSCWRSATYYTPTYRSCYTTTTYTPWVSYRSSTCYPSYKPSWSFGWSSSRHCKTSGLKIGVRW